MTLSVVVLVVKVLLLVVTAILIIVNNNLSSHVGRTIEVFEDTMHGSLQPKHHMMACKSNQ